MRISIRGEISGRSEIGIKWRPNRYGLTLLAACGVLGFAFTACSKEPEGNSSGGGGAPSTTANTKPAPDASGAAGANGKKKIVFVFKIGGISYSEACKAGADQANNDPALNATVEYQAPTEATAAGQAQIIEQAIVGKADAIVVSPNDADAILPSINKATDAGIKVFTWDADAPKSSRTFYVRAADDVQIGADILDAVAKGMGDKGKLLVFSGGRTAANLNLHLQGIEQALAKHPGITAIKPYVYNNDDKNNATTMAVQSLQANPDVTGIACVNSPSPPAAGEALRKLHLIGKVTVWGLALPSDSKPYLLDGSLTGVYLWDPQKLTYDTAKLVRAALDGKMPKDGDSIPEGKITVKDGVVTLPLRLEINKANVASLKF